MRLLTSNVPRGAELGHRHALAFLVHVQVLHVDRRARTGEPVPDRRRHAVRAFVVGGDFRRVEGADAGEALFSRPVPIAAREKVLLAGRVGHLAESLVDRQLAIGHGADAVDPVGVGRALKAPRRVPEQPILDDRAAAGEGRDVLVARVLQRRVLRLGGEFLGDGFEADAAVQLVGARARDGVGHEPGRASELRRDRAALDVELDHVEPVDLGAEIAEAGISDVDAIDQVDIVLPAAAAVRSEAGILGDAGNQLEEARVVAVQRQVLNLLHRVVEVDLGRLQIHVRGGGGDGDVLLDVQAEHDVRLRVPGHFDDHGPFGRADADLLDGHHVRARQQQREPVSPAHRRCRRAGARQTVARHCHGGVGDDRSPLIEHDTGNRSGLLRPRRGRDPDDEHQDECRYTTAHVSSTTTNVLQKAAGRANHERRADWRGCA